MKIMLFFRVCLLYAVECISLQQNLMMMTIKETFKSLIALKQQEITCVEMVPAKMKKRFNGIASTKR